MRLVRRSYAVAPAVVAGAVASLLAGCAAPGISGSPTAPLPARHADVRPTQGPRHEQVWTATFDHPCLDAALAPLVAASPAAGIPAAPESSGDAAAPEVVARGARVLSEDDPVGVYGQPEWTTRRRFARSRVYVLPEGQWEFEQWWRGTFDHGDGPAHLFQEEIGVGLPHRFQLDLYGNWEHEESTTFWSGVQPELRWAPADWGVLPLNPTLYLEYKWQHHAENVAEGRSSSPRTSRRAVTGR